MGANAQMKTLKIDLNALSAIALKLGFREVAQPLQASHGGITITLGQFRGNDPADAAEKVIKEAKLPRVTRRQFPTLDGPATVLDILAPIANGKPLAIELVGESVPPPAEAPAPTPEPETSE